MSWRSFPDELSIFSGWHGERSRTGGSVASCLPPPTPPPNWRQAPFMTRRVLPWKGLLLLVTRKIYRWIFGQGCNWGCDINLTNVKHKFKRPYCDVTYAIIIVTLIRIANQISIPVSETSRQLTTSVLAARLASSSLVAQQWRHKRGRLVGRPHLDA